MDAQMAALARQSYLMQKAVEDALHPKARWWERYQVPLPPLTETANWRVEPFTITHDLTLAQIKYIVAGRPVHPGDYVRLVRKKRNVCVMSDTPAEIADHLEVIDAARGSVLICGLGLGMVLQAVLRKPEVTRVDVIEKDPEVFTLWACDNPLQHDERLHVHVGVSAYDWRPTIYEYDTMWFDIWDFISPLNWRLMKSLRRRYHEWMAQDAYVGAWCEEQCAYLAARGRMQIEERRCEFEDWEKRRDALVQKAIQLELDNPWGVE